MQFLETLKGSVSPKERSEVFPHIEKLLSVIKNGCSAKVTKEQPISTGRVDIEILFPSEGYALYIENKMRSEERLNQLKDYHAYYEQVYPGKNVGIYLTKHGSLPESLRSAEPPVTTIVPLSYGEVIEWLEKCCFSHELAYHAHITASLLQYIQIIKSEMNIMENIETEEMGIFFQQPENRVKLHKLLTQTRQLDEIISAGMLPYRKAFLRDLKKTFEDEISKKDYYLSINDKEAFRCRHEDVDGELFFTVYIEQAYPVADDGGRGLWWGVYDDNASVFGFEIGLEKNCWETIKLGNIDDFYNDADGSKIIIETVGETAKRNRSKLLSDVANRIIGRIEQVVFPAFKERKTKAQR